MRCVVQRVSRAEVRVDGEVVGRVGRGLLVLVAATHGDRVDDAETLADKLAGLRIFPDEEGRMNRSVGEVGGGVLVVSQFTLYADTRRGRRPAFVAAAAPEVAEPLIERLVQGLRRRALPVETGRFGAKMEVELVNDGPVTLVVETVDAKVV